MKFRTYIFLGIGILVLGIAAFTLLNQGSDTDFEPVGEVYTDYDYFPPSTSFDPVELVPFDQLLTSEPNASFRSVLDNTHLDVYGFYPCDAGGVQETVVMFTSKYKPSVTGANTFDDAVAAVRDWEPYIIEDIGQFIFPGVSNFDQVRLPYFVDVSPTNEEETLGTNMRMATVVIDGKDTTIYYGWLLNYVLFANTQTCLEAVMHSVYSPH